jgi:hypothetical protein
LASGHANRANRLSGLFGGLAARPLLGVRADTRLMSRRSGERERDPHHLKVPPADAHDAHTSPFGVRPMALSIARADPSEIRSLVKVEPRCGDPSSDHDALRRRAQEIGPPHGSMISRSGISISSAARRVTRNKQQSMQSMSVCGSRGLTSPVITPAQTSASRRRTASHVRKGFASWRPSTASVRACTSTAVKSAAKR